MTIDGYVIHSPDNIKALLSTRAEKKLINTNKKISYVDIVNAFDIETTSFYYKGEKCAIMYEWTLYIDDNIIIGRTWEDFNNTMDAIIEHYSLNTNKRIIIWVHNLGFEFQFICKRLGWAKVFAIREHTPIYAVTVSGLEFRCSYLLSGYALSVLASQIKKHSINKAVGDLDYYLLRHSKTVLTEKELTYCVRDVLIVAYYIIETIDKCGDLSKIPLTKTGFVRKYCRNSCLYEGKNHKKGVSKFLNYRKLMKQLVLTPEEYERSKRAFQGGFTHANAFYSGKVMYNVSSYDFTSSYPAVMLSEKFPMSRGEDIQIENNEHLERTLKLYNCVFDVEFKELESVTYIEHPLSVSRCWDKNGVFEDNGRIVFAKSIKTTLTEQDFYIIRKFYKWGEMNITHFTRYKKDYLPTDFVKAILKLYEDKTQLKGVEGKEDEYLNAKEMLNSCYGMAVTDICRDEIIFDEKWETISPDIEKAIEKYNLSKNRFLFYLWGVFITAYARKNLFTGIYECGGDYIYSDTDSLKITNADKHQDYFTNYNKHITKKLDKAMRFHNIDINRTRPLTIDGIEKPLGVWDYEGTYTRFKTLGAKRYIYEKDGRVNITVSGVNKKSAVPYLIAKYGNNIFNVFDDMLYIPNHNDLNTPIFNGDIEIVNPTGKNTHTYINYSMSGKLIDYNGIEGEFFEYSSVHLEPCDFTLSLSTMYIEYLAGIREYDK